MNICVKTGARMVDTLGRRFPCDLFKVGDALVVRANGPLRDVDCYGATDIEPTHALLLDYACWDRLDDVGVAVVPLGNITGELLL